MDVDLKMPGFGAYVALFSADLLFNVKSDVGLGGIYDTKFSCRTHRCKFIAKAWDQGNGGVRAAKGIY